jgi:predicted amidohydrolase YtcJ
MTQQAPDLIVHNGKLVTEDERRSIAQAAAVRGGEFVAVGTDREVLALKGEQTKVINLKGESLKRGDGFGRYQINVAVSGVLTMDRST